MADILQAGLRKLADWMSASAEVEVYYTSKSAGRFRAYATYGKTKVETVDDLGSMAVTYAMDFLFRGDQFGVVPQRGDTVEVGADLYEVLDFAGDGCWRWSDPYKTHLRVHVKRIRSGE